MSNPWVAPDTFPATIDNRPSLPRIRYRIGRYSDFRAAMLGALDRSVLLRNWTHRQPDDPGIALLEGAAILGDILTFYQELYANEAWLRTASRPQSITALTRLIGYRAAPGLGGSGTVAFEIAGNSNVEVSAGFPFSAQLNGAAQPADFETSASILAIPGLSRFSLYARSQPTGVGTSQNRFATDALSLAAAGVTLKVNDRLMLVDDSNSANRQIAVVKSVSTLLDQTVVTIAGTWQNGTVPGTMTGYKLGRTFRAFGYNAPAEQFSLDSSNTLTSTPVDTGMTLKVLLEGFPLERQVDDLSAGITMLLDLEVSELLGRPENRFEARTALAVRSDTDSVGPMQGGITRVEFQPPSGGSPIYVLPEFVDRRTVICHEVVGQGFRVGGPREVLSGADTSAVDYFGDGKSYQALDGRLVQFVALNPDDTAARVEEATLSIDWSEVGDPAAVAVRTVSLAPGLTQFSVSDFPLTSPSIVVLGNVVPMTQGKTQPTVALGNGDARQVFQSFQVPKAPLTWLPDEAATPPRDAELQILVDDIAWTEVDSLFAAGPKDQVYILREDFAGNTWVQFGDGISGAILPSGVDNVTAQYRTGNGANGWRQSGTTPQANGQVANLNKIRLYDEVTGGTTEQDASHTRRAAPGRVEELGRLVSLSDFEFEALAQPGVEKARAIWGTEGNVPLLRITVLLSDDTPAQVSTVQAALSTANAARGANRFPVLVEDAHTEYVYVAASIGLVRGYQSDPVLAAVKTALGVIPKNGDPESSTGLFSVEQRQLGGAEYASRIEGVIQNVDGVAWVEVTAVGSLGVANDPGTLAMPAAPTLTPTLSCADDHILALYETHFSAALGSA